MTLIGVTGRYNSASSVCHTTRPVVVVTVVVADADNDCNNNDDDDDVKHPNGLQ